MKEAGGGGSWSSGTDRWRQKYNTCFTKHQNINLQHLLNFLNYISEANILIRLFITPLVVTALHGLIMHNNQVPLPPLLVTHTECDSRNRVKVKHVPICWANEITLLPPSCTSVLAKILIRWCSRSRVRKLCHLSPLVAADLTREEGGGGRDEEDEKSNVMNRRLDKDVHEEAGMAERGGRAEKAATIMKELVYQVKLSTSNPQN